MTNSTKIELTFTQCKQLVANDVNLPEFVEKINDQPEFMQGEMSVASICEIQSIIGCGCAGNAHKSVYYFEASQCMSKHGDDVLQYLEDTLGELPTIPNGSSWSQIASIYLSCAVDLWCGNFASDLDGVNWD